MLQQANPAYAARSANVSRLLPPCTSSVVQASGIVSMNEANQRGVYSLAMPVPFRTETIAYCVGGVNEPPARSGRSETRRADARGGASARGRERPVSMHQ